MIIVGLGNPGDEYKHTRHNAGFETIDKLCYDFNIAAKKKRFRAVYGEGRIAGKQALLVKPQTFMNLSGEAVRAILNFYKLTPADLIVISDDTALPTGEVRVRERGSAGGHNGLKNIIQNLGTEEFARVRVGVGAKPEGWDLADYVLSRFPKTEWESMIRGVTKAGDAVCECLTGGIVAAMNKFNKKAASPLLNRNL